MGADQESFKREGEAESAAVYRVLPKAQRLPAEPILTPRQGNKYWWEKRGTFNPGVALYRDKIILLYRAYDEFRISRLGLAKSRDGIHFRRYSLPVVDTDPTDMDERLGIEDPRITKIDGTYYIIHTAASYHRVGTVSDISGVMDYIPWRVRVAMHSTRDFKHFVHHDVILPEIPAKNGCLLPEKINGAFGLYYRQRNELKLSFTHDFVTWFDTQTITWPVPQEWQSGKFGLGSQPIICEQGYLLVYHAVDQLRHYRLGLMLLDRHDPTRLLWYSSSILEPEMLWEKEGYVPNVVYSCGAIVQKDELWIYYGAADCVTGRAILPLKGIL